MLNIHITNSHDRHLLSRTLSNSTLLLFLTWSSNQLSDFSPPILTRLPTALNLSTSTQKEEKAQTLQWLPLVQPIKSKALDLKLKTFPALTPRGLSSLGASGFPFTTYLTFQPKQTSCCSSHTPCFLSSEPFAHAVPFTWNAHPLPSPFSKTLKSSPAHSQHHQEG